MFPDSCILAVTIVADPFVRPLLRPVKFLFPGGIALYVICFKPLSSGGNGGVNPASLVPYPFVFYAPYGSKTIVISLQEFRSSLLSPDNAVNPFCKLLPGFYDSS